jgi:NAD(P)-dependent dehydrogenase (short-subunit alcohol dehydrogenase family)
MRRVLVVGANRGIGLEICRQSAQRGEAVVAACRRGSPALENLRGIEIHPGVNTTERSSLDALAATLGRQSLDTLMVVAGILEPVSLTGFDADSVRRQFEVNALGPLQTVVALQDCLRDGGKIGLLTSRMGSLADNSSGGSYGYRMSKAALNMAGVSLAHDLRPRMISVALLHPGYVRTDMTGHSGALSAREAAAGLLARMDELSIATTGRFVHQSGEALPW